MLVARDLHGWVDNHSVTLQIVHQYSQPSIKLFKIQSPRNTTENQLIVFCKRIWLVLHYPCIPRIYNVKTRAKTFEINVNQQGNDHELAVSYRKQRIRFGFVFNLPFQLQRFFAAIQEISAFRLNFVR